MHLRRALLLFAIVLGLAALAASLSRTGDDEDPATTTTTERRTPSAEARPAPVSGGVAVEMEADTPRTQRVPAGAPLELVVNVSRDGQVVIDGLGLSGAATPAAPARFDILPTTPRRYEVSFVPADGDERRRAGTLVVTGSR